MYLFLVPLLLMPLQASANVYKCTRNDGSVYYQDTICAVTHKQVTLLSSIQSIDKATIKKVAARAKKRQKAQKTKLKKMRSKDQKLTKKRKHAIAQCEKASRQIDEIRTEYRTGYTIKRGIALDRRLATYLAKKQQYCV